MQGRDCVGHVIHPLRSRLAESADGHEEIAEARACAGFFCAAKLRDIFGDIRLVRRFVLGARGRLAKATTTDIVHPRSGQASDALNNIHLGRE